VNQDLRTCVGRTYFQRTEVKSFGCDILRKIRPRFTYTTSNPVPNTRVTCEGRECWKTENGVVVACGPNWNCMDDPNFDLFTRRPASNPVVNSVGPSPPSPSGREVGRPWLYRSTKDERLGLTRPGIRQFLERSYVLDVGH
jgi:hypothetical protein